MDFIAGEVIYFNKPLTWTSFDLVNKFRYKLSRKLKVKKIKVGHAGTLDPLATGVMIICTGKATKRIDEFQYQTKEYVATLKLGETSGLSDRAYHQGFGRRNAETLCRNDRASSSGLFSLQNRREKSIRTGT